jgi:hypothetical protein
VIALASMTTRWSVALVLVLAACTRPNPGFGLVDGVERESTTDSPTHSTGLDTRDETGVLPGTSSTTAGDESSTGSEDSSGELVECSMPNAEPMKLEVAGLCPDWHAPRRGFLQRQQGGQWIFRECGNACDETCTPVHELLFAPAAVEPPLALDATCVNLQISQVVDANDQTCHTRSVAISNETGGRLAYASGWALEHGLTDLPFGFIQAEPACNCSKHDVACCPADGDLGPQTIWIRPSRGPELAVPVGSSVTFEASMNGIEVPYTFVNHRSLRVDCERPPLYEWFVREGAG